HPVSVAHGPVLPVRPGGWQPHRAGTADGGGRSPVLPGFGDRHGNLGGGGAAPGRRRAAALSRADPRRLHSQAALPPRSQRLLLPPPGCGLAAAAAVAQGRPSNSSAPSLTVGIRSSRLIFIKRMVLAAT